MWLISPSSACTATAAAAGERECQGSAQRAAAAAAAAAAGCSSRSTAAGERERERHEGKRTHQPLHQDEERAEEEEGGPLHFGHELLCGVGAGGAQY